MIKMKDNRKLIPDKDNPRSLKSTSLHLIGILFKDFNISVLSIKFVLLFKHPKNSTKIPFSIPK